LAKEIHSPLTASWFLDYGTILGLSRIISTFAPSCVAKAGFAVRCSTRSCHASCRMRWTSAASAEVSNLSLSASPVRGELVLSSVGDKQAMNNLMSFWAFYCLFWPDFWSVSFWWRGQWLSRVLRRRCRTFWLPRLSYICHVPYLRGFFVPFGRYFWP
jgi:hypothetical protein